MSHHLRRSYAETLMQRLNQTLGNDAFFFYQQWYILNSVSTSTDGQQKGTFSPKVEEPVINGRFLIFLKHNFIVPLNVISSYILNKPQTSKPILHIQYPFWLEIIVTCCSACFGPQLDPRRRVPVAPCWYRPLTTQTSWIKTISNPCIESLLSFNTLFI